LTKKNACLSILAGAFLWGIIGFFVKNLYSAGFTPMQVVAARMLTAFLGLLIWIFCKDRRALVIRPADCRYFVGTGVVSVMFFNYCLFRAIDESGVSIATILLYTAPFFAILFSRLLFGEALTKIKIAALVFSILGCAFVAGALPAFQGVLSLSGLGFGVGAGFFYALYSIFGKYALRKYNAMTISLYTFLFATLASVPFSGFSQWAPLLLHGKIALYVAGLGILSTILAFMLYTKGLEAIEAGRASIIASVEPVVAAVMSFLVFGERLGPWQYFGIGLVIGSIVLLQGS